ncbi:hypothetical protein B7C51_23345 [Paenibacillus larvae subsp. pulvifaciens]|uniref:Spore germination protein GerPC n=2 Tax=Paenibacillus larvae TaxID=1464 RepID=A0A1V0UY93_9BACL|nr:spore germination protein GerPC [Paenibacillus larvae]ARF70146.1 hypothetical protein B7C51_23345 [Paenibacillus larvae subsp. pulvifaciens]QHZ51927.1 spore germination protein GerPC [Paenibacillus larvae subsp. larvae]
MDYYSYQQLIFQIQWLLEKTQLLDDRLSQLQSDIDNIKQRNPTSIDRIEYHFDQLKIERLDGTLNIGLTPNGGKSLDDLTVNGQPLDQMNIRDNGNSHIHQQLIRYLYEQVPEKIRKWSEAHQVDASEITPAILTDIHQQLDERIRYYMHAVSDENQEADQIDEESVKMSVFEKVKYDIDTAVEQYISKTFKQGG